MTITKLWKNVKVETKKLQELLNYEQKGLLTREETNRLRQEMREIESDFCETICGDPHNNAAEDCLQCEIIKRNM